MCICAHDQRINSICVIVWLKAQGLDHPHACEPSESFGTGYEVTAAVVWMVSLESYGC